MLQIPRYHLSLSKPKNCGINLNYRNGLNVPQDTLINQPGFNSPAIDSNRPNGLAAICITSRGPNHEMPNLEDGINDAARYKAEWAEFLLVYEKLCICS